MTPWYEGPLAALTVHARRDTSRPGCLADPEEDRLTAASLVTAASANEPPAVRSWQVGPGAPAGPVVEALARALAGVSSMPLVVPDAPYDLTLLDRELRRHRHTPLVNYLGGRSLCVVDPLLLHLRLGEAATACDAGTLTQLCARYGVPVPAGADRHRPENDAILAMALGRALGRTFAPRLAGLSPAALHTLQAIWYAARARGLTPWFAPGGARLTPTAWPLRPPLHPGSPEPGTGSATARAETELS